jgi:hypothetical protein
MNKNIIEKIIFCNCNYTYQKIMANPIDLLGTYANNFQAIILRIPLL